MTTAIMLLTAFLAIVVVGGTMVALHDALERLWTARRAPAAPPARRRPVPSGTPGVAWRHLH